MSFDTVTLDLDGTLLPDSTLFMEVLRQNGREEDVRTSDTKFFAGALSLRDCFMEQWAWFAQLSVQEVHRALRSSAWIAGLDTGIARLRAEGLDVRLLTDQPSSAADFAARWGCGPAICSPVSVQDGRQIDIDFREDKLDNLRQAGLEAASVCHVGNGANDVPIWNAGATGIAVFSTPEVASQATVNLGRPSSFDAVVDAVLAQRGGK